MSLESGTFAIHWQECFIISININTVGFRNILLLRILPTFELLVIETRLEFNFLKVVFYF